MRFSALLSILFRVLLPPALIATTYLYLYPVFHGCGFPSAGHGSLAPFRLLALGDPQLEGDTSLPDPDAPLLQSWPAVARDLSEANLPGLQDALADLLKEDLPKLLQTYRKRLDLWGNDLYLAHIYHTLSWYTQPTHTVVLGDLLGSQWISDEEFERRSERFWGRVFRRGEKVPQDVMDAEGRTEVLGKEKAWERRLMAIAGNHDVGYAGDIDEKRVERFEDAFGRVNWDIRFPIPSNHTNTTQPGSPSGPDPDSLDTPELHLILLNSMNLDEPAASPELLQQSRDFADRHLYPSTPPSKSTATILLTHIPLHKPPGVCVDSPYFSHFPSDQGGGIREQNHLSEHVSAHLLDGLANSKTAIVLNGHDHEGCDTLHYRNQNFGPNVDEASPWSAERWEGSEATRRETPLGLWLREVTVRSMMGDFGGNAGLLSAWFDYDTRQWEFEYDVCALGVQHIWWAVHVLDLVWLGLGVAAVLAWVGEGLVGAGGAEGGREKVKRA